MIYCYFLHIYANCLYNPNTDLLYNFINILNCILPLSTKKKYTVHLYFYTLAISKQFKCNNFLFLRLTVVL